MGSISNFATCPECGEVGALAQELDTHTKWVFSSCAKCGYTEDEPPWVVDGICINGTGKWEKNVCSFPSKKKACDTCRWFSDYEGLTRKIREMESIGAPIGTSDLVRWAQEFNCEVPTVKDGKLVFKTI